jgi:hypothetical protein
VLGKGDPVQPKTDGTLHHLFRVCVIVSAEFRMDMQIDSELHTFLY